MATSREYDLILLGATGYTGKLTAEYIALHLPTNLKWAVAGRSIGKLKDLVAEIKPLNPDRTQPGIEPAQLNVGELTALAKKTKIILNCIGPYILYSIPVVEACAKTGTHYLDVTGETPFVKKAIDNFHALAEAKGALIIPQVGVDSSPSDLIALMLVSFLREKFSVGTNEIIASLHDFKHSGASGGTSSTLFTLVETFGLSELQKQTSPYSTSPLIPKPQARIPLLTKIFGLRTVPGLGILTTSLLASGNTCTVHRSSGLQSALYGPNFHYAEYAKTRNTLTGLLAHFGIAFGMLLLAFPPSRWALKKLLPQPGEGPEKGKAKEEFYDLRAIATADQQGNEKPRKAYGRFAFAGGMYWLTGLFLSEAAMVILDNEENLVKKLKGGVFTPAMLGTAYIERLEKAGCIFDARLLDE